MQEPEHDMIDISKENLITLDEAASLLPVGRQRRPVNGATILRWITDGSRGIRLEAVRIGGPWLERFRSWCSVIATVPQVVAALWRGESIQGAPQERPQPFHGPL